MSPLLLSTSLALALGFFLRLVYLEAPSRLAEPTSTEGLRVQVCAKYTFRLTRSDTPMTSSSSSPTSVRSVDGSLESSPESPHPIAALRGDGKSFSNNDVSSASTQKEPRGRSKELPIHLTRNLIMRLPILVGQLCSLFLGVVPCEELSKFNTPEIADAMDLILSGLVELAKSLSINLSLAIVTKMELNAMKYPVPLCKVNRTSPELALNLDHSNVADIILSYLFSDRGSLASTRNTRRRQESLKRTGNLRCSRL